MTTPTINNTTATELPLYKQNDNSQKPFESLVENVDGHSLFVQLTRILIFLDSGLVKLTFSDISPNMGALIKQMVQNKKNLYCLLHHSIDKCRKVAEEIIDKIKEKEGVYNLACRFDSSAENKGFLTYIKTSPNELSTMNSSELGFRPERELDKRLSPPSSPGDAETMNNVLESVNDNFKRTWLKATLAFVKDKSQTSYHYPNLSVEQIEFICSLFWENRSWNAWRAKMVDLLPLWEAMEIIGLKYDFRLTFVDNFKTDASCPDLQVCKVMRSPLRLMLEKVPKNKSKNEETNDISDLKYKLSKDFMQLAVQKILDFLSDELRASLIFDGMKSLECLFLQCVMKSTKPMFPGHEKLLEYIEKNRYTQNYEVKVDVGNLNRKTKLKSVKFTKEVNYDDTYMKQSLDRSEAPMEFPVARQVVTASYNNRFIEVDRRQAPNRKDKLLEAMSVPIDSDKAKKMMQSMGWNGGPLGKRGNGITEPIIPQLNLVTGAGLGHKRQTEKPQSNGNRSSRPASKTRVHTPQSTEVYLSSHAGGSNRHTTGEQFRVGLFENVLELLEGEQTSTVVRYNNKIPKKMRSFIVNLIGALDKREPLTLSSSSLLNLVEIELLKQALDIMIENEDLSIAHRIGDDKMSVTFTKGTKESIKQLNEKMTRMKDLYLLRNADGSYTSTFPKLCLSQSKYFYNLKMFTLINILDFLKDNQTFKALYFDGKNGKMCDAKSSYVQEVIDTVNRRFEKYVARSVFEQEVVNDIKTHLKSNVKINGDIIQAERVCFLTKCVTKTVKPTDTTNTSDIINAINANIQNASTIKKSFSDGNIETLNTIDKSERPNNITISCENLQKHNYTRVISNGVSTEKFGHFRYEDVAAVITEWKNRLFCNLDNFMSSTYNCGKTRPSYKIHIDNSGKPTNGRFKLTNGSRSKLAYRIGLFICCIDFLECTALELIINYKSRINPKYVLFLKIFTASLNKGTRMSLNGPVEVYLMDRLIELMKKHTGLQVVTSVDCTYKEVTVKKITANLNNPTHAIASLNQPQDMEKGKEKTIPGIGTTTIQPQNELNQLAIGFSTRFSILINVLEFLKSAGSTKELLFEAKVQKNECTIVTDMVKLFNESCLNALNEKENEIVESIKQFYGRVKLECIFDGSGQKCTLTKICTKKNNLQYNTILPTNNPQFEEDIKMSKNKNDIKIIENLDPVIVLSSDTEESIHLENSDGAHVTCSTVVPEVIYEIGHTVDAVNSIDTKPLGCKDNSDNQINKSSYSREFDKDLNELEKVINEIEDNVLIEDFERKECARKDSLIDRPPSAKRSRSNSTESLQEIYKKTKLLDFRNVKKLSIVPSDYPDTIITKDTFVELQKIISDTIDKESVLPLLQCHGVQDGALVYGCYNEDSLFFLENILHSVSNYKIMDNCTDEVVCYNLKIKMNTLCQDLSNIFSRLEQYNKGLNTESWGVTDVKIHEESIQIYVSVDKISYDYICDSNFSLYAGVDIARFSIVWN